MRLCRSVSKASPFASPSVLALHRLLDDWGEGTSDAPGEEGKGAAALSPALVVTFR